MSGAVRLGAVDYLNVRPLVYGLDRHSEQVTLRFDVPSVCAELLATGQIDLGMVPSIAYLDRPSDRIVPGVCIGSDGPVASVALFTRRPIEQVRTLALDTSSRTSVVLIKILCEQRFRIRPAFASHEPDLPAMLEAADAALIIGDPALFADPAKLDAQKIDLGAHWTEMTGLPFVWAFWAGPATPRNAAVVALLQRAAETGMTHTDAIAADYCRDTPARIALAQTYLRNHLMFRLDDRAINGLRRFYREAATLKLVPGGTPAFFSGEAP